MPLCSVEHVKMLLELADTDTTMDQLIEEHLQSISEEMSGYCNRVLAQDDFTEYHDGGKQTIFLLNPPITEVIAVHVDPDLEWPADSEISVDDYFLVNSKNGELFCKTGRWAELNTPNSVRVVYTGGYREGEVPKDLEMAIGYQVAFEIRRRKDPGLISVSFPDGSIQKRIEGRWLNTVKDTLDRYTLNIL